MLALWIILGILGYLYVGGFIASRYMSAQALASNHNPRVCFQGTWCGHACVALWIMGPLWPIALPIIGGLKSGSTTDRVSRDDKRRAKELAEAEHKAKLARMKADEHAALDRELALLERKKELA